MLLILVRTAILYIIALFAMRLMGKRQIGQLQPSELVVAIMISEVAAIPMENPGVPLIVGIVPVFALIVTEMIISFISLKSAKARRIISGTASILIRDGKIDEKEMEKQRYNIDDLMEELRINNYADISEIEYAVLETSGQISIIPKTSARPVTVSDLSLNMPEAELPYTVIADGAISKRGLEASGKSEDWLKGQLKKHKIESVADVFIATVDASGTMFVQTKKTDTKDGDVLSDKNEKGN